LCGALGLGRDSACDWLFGDGPLWAPFRCRLSHHRLPPHLKDGIEGIVEDRMGGIPFDVVYLDEIPAHKLGRFTREAVDAGRLR
jgi:hypothetical protein